MSAPERKSKAPRNRSIALSEGERTFYKQRLLRLHSIATIKELENRTINQDLFEVLDWLPRSFVDLLFLDPPYNLTKSFNEKVFRERTTMEYSEWFETWFPKLLKTLKPTASIYICADWRSSAAIHLVAEKYVTIRNRITWEREKGRGAKSNWKNSSEDIFFCTVSQNYIFNVDLVKLKRRVIAPYTNSDGEPKDWERTDEGDFRLTYPSNVWTDLTVPFWSMPENTEHPTQKPEKLLAKVLLASSNAGDVVLDPFLGSGTTSVTAKKLGRRYVGIETDPTYCCLAEKRLDMAEHDKSIQGYAEGIFWERNSLQDQKDSCKDEGAAAQTILPFFAGDAKR